VSHRTVAACQALLAASLPWLQLAHLEGCVLLNRKPLLLILGYIV
jgi:hypothetical protein